MHIKVKSIVTRRYILKANCQCLPRKANRDGTLLCVKLTPII